MWHYLYHMPCPLKKPCYYFESNKRSIFQLHLLSLAQVLLGWHEWIWIFFNKFRPQKISRKWEKIARSDPCTNRGSQSQIAKIWSLSKKSYTQKYLIPIWISRDILNFWNDWVKFSFLLYFGFVDICCMPYSSYYPFSLTVWNFILFLPHSLWKKKEFEWKR